MLPVTLVYFCYGWTLWLFLTWIPQYFLHNYHMNLKNSAVFASGVFFAGVLGDSLGGHVTDWLLMRTGSRTKARSYMVAVCNLGALASLLPILFIHDSTVAAIALSLGFFFAELTIGPMWAIPMDIAPKHSGTASGFMNMGSALAAILSAGGGRLDHRCHRQLGLAVHRIHGADARGRCVGLRHEAGTDILITTLSCGSLPIDELNAIVSLGMPASRVPQ